MLLRRLLLAAAVIGFTQVPARACTDSVAGPIEAVKQNEELAVAGCTFKVTAGTQIATPDGRPATMAELLTGIEVEVELAEGPHGLQASSIVAKLLR